MVNDIKKATVKFSFVQRRHQLGNSSVTTTSEVTVQASTLFCELSELLSWCEEKHLLPDGSIDFSVQECFHPIKTNYILRVGTETREVSSSAYNKDTLKSLFLLMEYNLKDKVVVRLSDDGNKLIGFTV